MDEEWKSSNLILHHDTNVNEPNTIINGLRLKTFILFIKFKFVTGALSFGSQNFIRMESQFYKSANTTPSNPLLRKVVFSRE